MRPQNDAKTLLFDSVLIFLGIVGTLGCFIGTFGIPINSTSLIFMILATSIAFFVINTIHKHLRLASLISLGVFILILTLNFNTCKNGFFYIMNCILQTYENNSQYSFQSFSVSIAQASITSVLSFTIWVMFTPMIMVIVYSIRQRNAYFLSFMVSVPFLFAILVFTLVPPWNPFVMLLLFYMGMLGMHVASRFEAHSVQDSIRKLGLLFMVCCLLVIIGIKALVPVDRYVRDPRVDSLRLQVQSSIRDMIYGATTSETGIVDLATARDRYYIGSSDLQVKSDKKNTIYLHGYSGTLYKDNTWFTPELSYYTSKLDFLTPPHPFDITNLYHQGMSEAQKESVEIQNIDVTYVDAPKTYMYTPYYMLESISENKSEYTAYADAYLSVVDEEVSTYPFAMLSNSEAFPNEVGMTPYVQAYMDAVMFTNLTVPTQVEETLRGLRIPTITSASSQEDKIKAIQAFTKSFGTYTLSPGSTPTGKDFIGYFLENKRGYCVHYASMATMLLRLQGIPARYAEGYRVDAADFNGDIAIAKDYNAHAWVEVFDNRFGWVPLEVTPASAYGSGTTNITLQNQDPQIQSQNQASNPTVNTPADPTTVKSEDPTSISMGRIATLMLFISCIAFVAGIPIRRMLIIRKREQMQHQENRKEAILEVAKSIAYFVKDKQLPKDIREILEEARFSTHKMHEEQYILIMQYQKLLRKQAFTTCTWNEKMKYMWWYCV